MGDATQPLYIVVCIVPDQPHARFRFLFWLDLSFEDGGEGEEKGGEGRG